MKTFEQITEEIKKELKTRLHWKNDYQQHSSDGKFYLNATIGANDVLYTLYDENDQVIEQWHE